MKAAFTRIQGNPVGKGRPRFDSRSGRAYTPGRSRSYEQTVRMEFEQQNPDWAPTEEPVKVYIRCAYTVPKSWTKRQRLLVWLRDPLAIWKKTKPDLDNIIKSILDGLNGVAWKDDSQICVISAQKFYDQWQDEVTVNIEVPEESKKLAKYSTKELQDRFNYEAQREMEEETDG